MRSSGHYVQTLIPRTRTQVRLLTPWLVLPTPIFCYPCPSNEQIVNLEETAQQLRHQPSDSQHTANQEDGLYETIGSLRAVLRARDEYSSAFIATLPHALLTSISVRQQNRTSRTNNPGTPRPTAT